MTPQLALRKVAEITLLFWVAKIIATTLGEVAGDVLAQTLDLGYVVGFAITMIVILIAQVRSKTYHPLAFWAAIVGTTTAGTEIADMCTHTFGLGYTGTSAILFAGLVITLAAWYVRKGTVSVEGITDRESETLFWIAVLFSNSLGTAFGDGLVYVFGLSYVTGAILCSAVIAIVLLLHYVVKVNDVLIFWAAFIFTRPFGADFGNFLTKEQAKGGLELSTIQTALVATALLVVIVVMSEHGGRLIGTSRGTSEEKLAQARLPRE